MEAGFARWGCDIGNHIYGSFALALFDEASGKLFCARDPLGLKPFYYRLDSAGELQYGSAIEDVVDGPDSRQIDPEALQRYLMLGYPARSAHTASAMPSRPAAKRRRQRRRRVTLEKGCGAGHA